MELLETSGFDKIKVENQEKDWWRQETARGCYGGGEPEDVRKESSTHGIEHFFSGVPDVSTCYLVLALH
jgi:hypothetical protein